MMLTCLHQAAADRLFPSKKLQSRSWENRGQNFLLSLPELTCKREHPLAFSGKTAKKTG